jgi:phospholipid/cholesterol/gamma-HCH transport system substrate-binding protein
VTNVRFADEDTYVIVTAEIQDKYHLRKNEVCCVHSNLLGDATLEFIRAEKGIASAESIKNGDTMEGKVILDPNQLIQNIQNRFNTTIDSVQFTSQSLGMASERLTKTLTKLNDMLDENRDGIKGAITQANEVLSGTNEVIGDKETQAKLRAAIRDMPEMIAHTHEMINKMNANLDNVGNFTQKLGENGDQLIGNLKNGTEDLDKLLRNMNAFSESLNNSQGTIGKMVNDPELYQHINRAARNIEELSRQLKPIVDDARVFSDKIARHPEMLGVRGAIQKSPGIK